MSRRAAKVYPVMQPPPPYPPRQSGGFWQSLLHAWAGLIHTVVHQRNMRLHVLAAIMVGLVGSGIPLGLAEKVTLIFCVLIVFFAEILNSALEQLVDLAVQQFDEKARVTKDAAAAGVMVLAAGTVVIFTAICVHDWDAIASNVKDIQRQVIYGLPLVVCAAVLMSEPAKPMPLLAALFLAGAGLIAAMATWSRSWVFTAATAGFLVMAGAAGLQRAKNKKPGD
jgi:diacylglycerol kinase (ATP)